MYLSPISVRQVGFFEIFTFFLENYDPPECICRLLLSDECVDDFGVRHEAGQARHEAL